MKKSSLYLPGFAVDCAFSATAFVIPLIATRMGATATQVGLLSSLGSLCYISACLLIAPLSDRIGPRRMILFALTFVMSATLALGFSRNLWQMAGCIALYAMSMGCFWPPYQSWIAQRGPRVDLMRRLLVFNLFWSAGLGVGQPLAGSLYELGERVDLLRPALFPLFVGAMLILATLALVLRFEAPSKMNAGMQNDGEENSADEAPLLVKSTFLYIALLANLSIWLAQRFFISLFPRFGLEMGLSPSFIGILLGSILLCQAVAFFLFGKYPGWHYRFAPLVTLQVLVIGGCCLIGILPLPHTIAIAFLAIGFAGGLTYYSSLYYSLTMGGGLGRRAAIHETAVGLGNLLGPVIGGKAADMLGRDNSYFVIGGVLCLTLLAQVILRIRLSVKARALVVPGPVRGPSGLPDGR